MSTQPAAPDRLTLFNSFAAILERVSVELASAEVLRAACQSIVENIPAVGHVGLLLTHSKDFSTGEVVAEFPDSGALHAKINLNPSLYEQMHKTGMPLTFKDISSPESELLDEANREVLMELGIKALMIVPLIVKGKLIGSLGLDVMVGPYEFTEDEIQVMAAAGKQIAISIHNAQLFAAAEKQTSSQATVQRIIQRLPLRSDLNTLLRTTAEEIGGLLEAIEAHIHILPVQSEDSSDQASLSE